MRRPVQIKYAAKAAHIKDTALFCAGAELIRPFPVEISFWHLTKWGGVVKWKKMVVLWNGGRNPDGDGRKRREKADGSEEEQEWRSERAAAGTGREEEEWASGGADGGGFVRRAAVSDGAGRDEGAGGGGADGICGRYGRRGELDL